MRVLSIDIGYKNLGYCIVDFNTTFDKKDELEKLVKGEKYYIHTYGCQANVRDEETMRGMLEKIGYLPTETVENADVIIINTCAVRENAEDKVYGEIGNLKYLRKKNKLALAMWLQSCLHYTE